MKWVGPVVNQEHIKSNIQVLEIGKIDDAQFYANGFIS